MTYAPKVMAGRRTHLEDRKLDSDLGASAALGQVHEHHGIQIFRIFYVGATTSYPCPQLTLCILSIGGTFEHALSEVLMIPRIY